MPPLFLLTISTFLAHALACADGEVVGVLGVADALHPRRALRQAPPQPTHPWPPTHSSPFFPYDCAPHASNTSLLLAVLADGGGGGGGGGGGEPGVGPTSPLPSFPPWIPALCPEVASHFAAFPYFPAFHRLLPVSTTLYAAAGVCTLKIAAALAEGSGAVGAKTTPSLMLFAGSHLGALVHGGPLPWDDDIDAALPWEAKDRFLERCGAAKHALHPTITLACVVTGGAVKVFVRPREEHGVVDPPPPASFSTATPLGWSAPFVDLFLYKVVGDRLVEVAADSGALSGSKAWRLGQALPARPLYFAGLILPAPPTALAASRYDLRACVTAPYNHRHEEWLPDRGRALHMDCCALAGAGLPFVVGGGAALVGGTGKGGEVRALDLRRLRGKRQGGGGGGSVGGGASIAGAAAVLEDDDAEAVPLVLVASGGMEGDACGGGGGGGGRLCGGTAATISKPARLAAILTAACASLASVIGLAWWLPGRRVVVRK